MQEYMQVAVSVATGLAAMVLAGANAMAGEPGADAANSRFFGASNSSSPEYRYLALRDHTGPSGVPLGGIGAGCVQWAPDGHFTRSSGINKWFTDSATEWRQQNKETEDGHFVAIFERLSDRLVMTRRFQRDAENTCGMPGFKHSVYRGLFPVAESSFIEEQWPSTNPASIRMWSGLVSQVLARSTVPAFWIEVTVANGLNSQETAVALSWADLIGRGLLEPVDPKTVPTHPFELNQSHFKEVARPVTVGKPVNINGWTGVMQTVAAPLPAPAKLTYQTAVTQVLILAEPQPASPVSILPAYTIAQGEGPWAEFREKGAFPPDDRPEAALSAPGKAPSASAIAVRSRIPSGGKRTFRFLVAWYAPPVTPDPARANDPRYRYGTGDYGTWYQNNFQSVQDVATHAIADREKMWAGIRAWQDPILESNLPDWLKFKLINSAYTLYTNAVLNRDGDFSTHEGGMGGLMGTMDVRNIAHLLYQKFFPSQDRRELRMFAASQEPALRDGKENWIAGAITHFNGHYFLGMASPNTPGPCPIDVNTDGTCGYIMQLVKEYEQTGDKAWLAEHHENIRKALGFLKRMVIDDRGIPRGRETYDDYHHPEVFNYAGSMMLMGTEAAIRAAQALDDQAMLEEATAMRDKARSGYQSLWNGQFYSYGSAPNSTVLENDRFHQGQVAGQSLTRLCGWDDNVPWTQLNSVFDLHCTRILNQVPDYYADKLWDLSMNRGVDSPGSRCWPFQLEAFTAMPMIQAGRIEDGFAMMRHVQLVHLRNGWTWTQNLWNPGELTRMDAPVTWMILDNLAGAALNVPEGRLILGWGVIPGQGSLKVPLYFPRFWAVLDYRPADRQATLTITRTFGDETIVLRQLTGRPMGRPSSEAKTVSIPPFAIKAGAVLDLSPYMDVLGPPVLKAPLLH